MILTKWIGGAEGSLMPLQQDSTRPIVAATYNVIENEVPIVLPHIYDHLEPNLRTEIKHRENSVDVYLNNTKVPYIETDSQLKRLQILADATFSGSFIRMNYIPGDNQDYYGDARFERNLLKTNIVRRFIPINARVINQIRVAINNMENTIGILQSRWIGGIYTDSFSNVTGSADNPDAIQSNIIPGQTLFNQVIFDELLISLYDIADYLGISISKYNDKFIIANKQINASWLEAVRSAINDIEEIL